MLCSLLDEGDINPKVLQLIGNEKIQVRKSGAWSRAEPLMESEDGACFLGEQARKPRVRAGVRVGGALGTDWAACLT